MATLTYPPIQHPMYASAEDLEKGALSPVWALWFEQMQTHAVAYASEQFFEVYSGEFKNNDPAPGHISWDKIKVKYNGVRYAVNAISGGTDAQGEVTVQLKFNGRNIVGHGADLDVIVASARAYINALNRLEFLKRDPEKIKPEYE